MPHSRWLAVEGGVYESTIGELRFRIQKRRSKVRCWRLHQWTHFGWSEVAGYCELIAAQTHAESISENLIL